MEKLNVYLHEQLTGKLWLDENRKFIFQYDPGYLSLQDIMSLSISFNLQQEPLVNDKAKPFFSNLLPEGDIKKIIAKQYQISSQNDYLLLKNIEETLYQLFEITTPENRYLSNLLVSYLNQFAQGELDKNLFK